MSDTFITDMFDQLLEDGPHVTWHEEFRHDLGIPDECAGEAMLTLLIQRPSTGSLTRSIAFIIDPGHARNTLKALTEFLREAFHPLTGRDDVLAVIDFLPPLDALGGSVGIGRRWVVDSSNYQLMLGHVSAYVGVLARGL